LDPTDRVEPAGAIVGLGKIAGSLGGRWNRIQYLVRTALARAFIIEEKESFVFAVVHPRNEDRPADVGAEGIALEESDRNTIAIVLPTVGIEVIIAQKFIRCGVVPDLVARIATPPATRARTER
jgi:hypothetical protein